MKHIHVALVDPFVIATTYEQKGVYVSQLMKLCNNIKDVLCVSSFCISKAYANLIMITPLIIAWRVHDVKLSSIGFPSSTIS